jgi:energy-coupling factor transporter ATP-binding protein EcfA2
MVKIKSINIRGIRGIKDSLPLNLDGKSVLVFGENGSGKSSLTDAVEWYYSDSIQHLTSEEIESTKGRGALRNIFIPDNEDAYITIQYSNNILDAKKSINNLFKTSFSNKSDDFNEFIGASKAERLILRYRDLVAFIIAPKKEKLDQLQNIIGFSEVANLRHILKTSAVRIGRTIKSANYDNQKNAQQSFILEYLGQNAYTNEQLIAGANKLIEPLKIGTEIKTLKDIQGVLKTIESKEDTALSDQISLHTKIGENLTEIFGNIEIMNAGYESYYTNCGNLQKDHEKIKKLQILALLKEGQNILRSDVVQGDYCPLCQQEKNKIELIAELNERIKELEGIEQEKCKVEEQGQELGDVLQNNINTVDGLLKDKNFKEKENSILLKKVQGIKTSLDIFSNELKKDFKTKAPIQEPSKIRIDKKKISALVKQTHSIVKQLTERRRSNIRFQIYNKLFQTVTAYNGFQDIEKRLATLTRQQSTFQTLSADFIKRQETALNAFLTVFSNDINNYYTTMNPSETVEGIKLVTMKDKNDDLDGLTIEYRFFDKTKRVPNAYLSESHVNCLGLSFFLASVKAFNKKNKFIVLDDVISSYDRSHRARFIKLLTDTFNEHQILLLTHEQEFFDLVSSEVKSKGWLIRKFVWSKENGTGVEEGLVDSKERILKKFRENNSDGLGNDIRIYTEKVMKEISNNIEAEVAFRYNEINEKRMASELLDAVHSRISKKGSGLKEIANIPRVKGMSMFIGNTTSHDTDFSVNIEDLKVMWEDISKTIQTFYCVDCKTFIAVKYFDNVGNKIRCRCGKLAYNWKQ